MTSRSRWLVTVLAVTAIAGWAGAVAGPGSGTALITPSAPVAAGFDGEWGVQYTAAEAMQDGRIRVTIPTGWSAPQSGNSTSAGYVTVSTNEPTGAPVIASIAGQVVNIDVDTLSVGNTVTLVYGDDSGSSSARAQAATTVGSYVFLVASDPTGTSVSPLAASPSLTVIAATPSTIEIAPSDTTVTAGAFAEYRLIVRDEFGNRAPVASTRTVFLFPGHGAFYSPSNHGATIPSIQIVAGTTSRRVDYRGTLATAPGSPHTIFVTTQAGSPQLAGNDQVSIIPASLSTTQSTITATSPKIANGSDQSSVTVTSKDAFSNLREGDSVSINATGSAVEAQPGGDTDENGEALAVVTNTVAENVTVSATINGQTLAATAPIVFTAGPASGVTSTVAATSPVVANGTSSSTITVTAEDANGNLVAGQTVSLSITPPGAGATLTQPAFVTNQFGVATGTLTSTTVGARTVSALIGATPVTDTAIVNFTAGSIASFEWSVDGAAVAGTSEQVTLTAKDAQGHTITTYTGTVNLSTNSTGVGNGVVEWSDVDAQGTIVNGSGDDATYTFDPADNGVAALRITDTKAETIILSASQGAGSGSSLALVVSPGAPDEVQLVTGDGQSATVNTAVATPPKVKVVDAFGNAVTGATVTFTVLAGGGTRDVIAGGGTDVSGPTASDGTIDCDVWRLGTDIDTNPNQLGASIASGTTPSVTFTATAIAGPGNSLVLTPGSKGVTVGSNEQVMATLIDSFGNPKSGEMVTVVIKSGSHGRLDEDTTYPGTTTELNEDTRQGLTDATGRITVQYEAPVTAGLIDVLDASTPNVAQGAVTDVSYTSDASGATNVRVTWVGSSTQMANTAGQFIVEAVDGGGNRDATSTATILFAPEPGSGLQFSLTNFGATITQTTLAAGVRTVYVRGTAAGSWDIGADDTGPLGADQVTFIVTDTGIIDHYSVSTVPSVVAGASFDVSISARDQYDNLVDGASNSVTLTAIDDVTTSALTPNLVVTSGSLSGGQAMVGTSYTKVDLIRVRVSAGGKEGISGVITVTPDVAKRIAKVSGDGTGIAAGSNRSLTVRVFDQYNNPVSSQQVTFLVLEGGGSVNSPVATGGTGDATATLTTGPVAGDNRVRASILDGSPAVDELVEFSVATVAGAIDHFTVVPQKTSLIAGEVVPITITAYDAGDNVVTSDNTTQVNLTSSGNAQFGSTPGTLTAGVFNTTVTDTLVQNFTVTAQRVGGGPSGTSVSISVANAGAYRVVKSTGDGSGITAGTTRVLNAIVRDQYSNVVPNALVTFSVLSAPDGTGSFTDTSGDPNDGIAVANGSGVATVTYTTAQTAGANQVNAQILDGAPASREKVTFTVNTVAGGIAYYGVEINATGTTAGVSKTVTVTAYDSNDNVVDDDATQVALTGDPGTGLAFGTNPLTLTNGVKSTSVTANLVQTYRVRASTVGSPSITGLSGPVDVVPAPPAGAITATATQNTITANGTSTTAITSSVIRDAFTNQVAPGSTVNVSASNGGVIVGGGAKTIGADGRIAFTLQSSTTPGPSTVTMTSEAPGTATGNIIITFAQKPALAANNPPTPAIVVPGQSVAFSVQVNNTAPNSVDLTTATTFTFTDGTRTYSSTLAAPQTIPGNGNVVLAFSSATVNAAFTTASYSPDLNLIGTDQYSAPVNVTVSLPAASLLVTSIEMTSIVPEFGVVSRGQTFDVAVTVKNNGAQSTVINDVDLVFIPAGLFTVGNAPELGQSINSGASKVFNVPVTVQIGAVTQSYQIDAVATGTVGGQPVTDNAIAPYPTASVQVTTAATLVYESGTLSPTTVSSGDPYGFQVTIRNTGGGLVLLNPAQTTITFTDGTRTYSAQPVQSYAIAGGGATQVINFTSSSVNGSFTPGSYPVTLNAGGTENGSPFSQAVPLTSVLVQSPAAVTANGDVLNPEQVTKTTTAAFTVQVQNTGGATVVLTPGTTTIRFASNQYTATLNASGPTTLPPGTTTLQFLGATVSNAIAAGNYLPTVQLTGTENGNPFSQSIALTDDVVVQNPPAIVIQAMQSSQTQFTQDQDKPIKVRMVVSNTNGSNVTFTAASMRFIHAGIDRTSQFVISTPSSFQGGPLLTSGEIDTVVFNVADNAGNPMSVGNMTIEGDLEVEEVNTGDPVFADTDLGGKGNLMVMTPAAIVFDAVIPSQTVVTQSMGRDIKVRAVVRNSGGSDVVLTLSNPASHLNFSPPSGWAVTSPAIMASGNSTLTGGELDTLIFNVTTSGSTPGPATVSVSTFGDETNSGRDINQTSSPANMLVESPGSIQVVSVVPSQASVTENTPLPWTITVTLTNPGESDVNLALGGSVGFTMQDQGTPPSFTIPAALAGGGTLLSGGETDQFVISLTSTGSFTSRGAKDITVDIDGTEVNSGLPKNVVNSTGSVLVQQKPDAAFVSLVPGTVSRLTSVAFAVDIRNPSASNRATMTLDRNLSRLRFGSNQYNVGLAPASPVDIAAGATETIQFAGATVGAGVPLGVQTDAELELHWTHNGITDTETITIPTSIIVEDAPVLSILSVRPSKTTLTRQQSPAGTVTMVVRNSGGAPVNLNLGAATTRLGFKVFSSGATLPPTEYLVQQPTALEFGGGTVLAGGATDSLVFDLTQAGVTTGLIIVNGYVGGIDLNSSQPVSDDTFDGGSGSLELQLPGALSILSITPSQATATAGQTTKSYVVKMAVRNAPGAASVDVSLPQASSDIQFVGKSGFVHSDATMTNGVTLAGGETDTLRFTVTTTGAPAGLTTITGNVSGVEGNTGLPRTDDTVSGGTGSILLQTPASLIVDSVTPSQASVTELTSAPWSTTIVLHNAGQSDARLNLPAGFSINVLSGTTSFVAPADLEEGGVILAGGASGTLISTTPTTGDFTTLGSRTITATVGATELNSNRALTPQGTGSVVVQTTPNLAVLAVRPAVVTSASVVDFEVDVQNPGANSATARLNRGLTRVHFASQAFSAVLDEASADSIEAGETVTLRFEAKVIPTSIPVGPYTLNVNLAYAHNGIGKTELETSNVSVQAAPQLAITQIVTSQPSVTANQSAPWTATMTVMNNGAADIDLDLSAAKTRLTFIGPGGSQDTNYIVSAGVVAAGEDTLSTSEVANIVFTITTTGNQTGNIVISGRVEGRDLNQLSIVTDDTFDGGRGGILVQSLPSIAVTAVHATQPKVTVGQAAWSVRVLLANTGGADVNVNLGTSVLTMPGGTTFGSPTLFGGGNTLEGGAVDSLLFQVVSTGSAGVHAINASVPWNEVNSSGSGTATTNASNDGQVTVQTQPNLRITTTTSQAPNPGEVNTNQAFSVAVQVQNTGQADANDVLLNMTRNGSSVIAPITAIPTVAGGQTVTYPLAVTAAATPNPSETFTTSLVSAHDANSGRTDLITTQPPADATAAVAVQNPAVLDILTVRPSQTTVTRGQSNPWNVIVRLRNPGQADAVLAAPDDDDLDFSLSGATKIDYAVTPPAQFGSGSAGWTLAGGATDSLIYTVVDTGNDPGLVDIGAAAAGTDFNDPTHAVSDTGAGTVNVQDLAGVFIATTVPVGTFNHATADRDTVNTNFGFEVHVTVQNSGGEGVDSVLVQLTSDGGSPPTASTIAPASLKRESIAAGASRDFVFRITSRATPDPLETFQATILPGVRSANSGQTVIPQQPIDRRHDIVIRSRANLVTDLYVASPPGSVNGVVSPSQQFTLGTRVTNAGQANVSGPAEVTLTVPAGFTVQESLVRAFVTGAVVTWTVTAPPTTQSALDFTCAITTTPNDLNTAATAFVSQPGDNQSVTVSTGGALASPNLAADSPAGAMDDTLSVGQTFFVNASVTATDDTDNVVATLTLPVGFSIVNGSLIRNLGNGPGNKETTYRLLAPTGVATDAEMFVTFTGVDRNSGDPVPSAADAVLFTVVPRTSLTASASITAPPAAIDKTVAVSTEFTVTAAVSNSAGAADIAAPGSLQVSLPTGYSFAAGHTAQKPFVVGMPVSWDIIAAAQPSGPDQLTISIVNIPEDENSGDPAQVAVGAVNIPMVTEGAAVAVRNISSAQGVDTGVAPGGAKDLDVLAFEIRYNVTDDTVNPAEVDTIALTIIGSDGNALGPNVVAQTLARIAIDLGGTQPYEVSNPSTNPVLVSLEGGGTDRDIPPDGAINAVVYVDLDTAPRATELRVRVSDGMIVRDPGRTQPLNVTDPLGQPLDGQVTSGSLVVLSSNFEEYAHNAPNPFRAGSAVTQISYFLGTPSNVDIRIFDITGELVYEESIPSGDARAQPGPQESPWDGRNMKGDVVRNGIYVCVLNAGGQSAKFRIAVAK